MRRLAAIVVGLLTLPSALAFADPDLVIIAAPGTEVSPADVEAILRDQLPGLAVTTTEPTSGRPAGARVLLESWPDGRVAVEYRDGHGRQTTRIVALGEAPAATIAMVVVNLQQDQLDSILGQAEPVPAPVPHARAHVRPTADAAPPVFSPGLGLGLTRRNIDVQVEGSPKPRSFAAPAFPTIVLDASFFPGRLATRNGPGSWIGASVRFVRDLYLQTSGIDASASVPVDIESSLQELQLLAVLDAPLGARDDGPRLRASGGWASLVFYLDPTTMAALDTAVQMPSFEYEGVLLTLDGELPIGDTGLRAGVGLSWFEILDVGQAVRDLFGSKTSGARGLGARASLRGEILARLDGELALQFRSITTEMSGVSSYGGGAIGGFPSATDEYLDFRIGLSYRLD